MDLISIISLLHNKTTMYKEVDIDNYKYLYEKITNTLNDTYNYYNYLMDNIDSSIYMSPSDYLISRNISIVYSSLNYAKNELESWYKLIENKRKIRVTVTHNNLKLDHYLKSDKPYLISWDKSRIDMPIYDLISLYHNHYLEFDFNELLEEYLSKYPLTIEEMQLFLTIISIPNKIELAKNEYSSVLNVRRIFDYLYKTSSIIDKYKDYQKNSI